MGSLFCADNNGQVLYYLRWGQLPLSIFYSDCGSIVVTGADMYECWFGDTQNYKQTV